MKRLLYIAIFNSCFAGDLSTLFKMAKEFEDAKDYKNAMLIYKQIAQQNQNLQDDNLNVSNTNLNNYKKEIFKDNIVKTDDEETNSSLEQIVTKDFGIYPYKKNYFLPATYSFNNFDDRKNFETSFQLSFEKPISYDFFGLNEVITLAYTQKSFWQTASNSAPFRETNYEPEVFIQIPTKDFEYLRFYKLAFLHSSNGKGANNSRSLNRVYLQGFFQFGNIFVAPKVWYRIPEDKSSDNNPDFYDYYGYADINFLYTYKKHTFELLARNNLKLDSSNKGAVEFNWSFPLPEFISSKNSYGIFQIFHGYGQSLIDYDKEITNVGVGIAFSR